MSTMEEFFEDFDDASREVVRARHQDFSSLVRRWFAAFEEAPQAVRERLSWLETLYPWSRVEAEVLRPQSGMGPGDLRWPEDREMRLSAQLALFRRFAQGKPEGWNFAFDYFRTNTNNIGQTLHNMTDALFEPSVSELRKYLVRKGIEPLAARPTTVPASDRVVPLDHNSSSYEDLVGHLEKIDAEVSASNSLSPEVKERAVAEVGAIRTMLRPANIRRAVVAGILGCLGWMLVEFADAVFQPHIQQAINALHSLFPWSA